MDGNAQTRRASPADADLLVRWSAEPHVAAATGGDEPENWHALLADEPPWSATYIGEVDDRPVGVVCVLDPHADPTVDAVIIDVLPSNTRALPFYARLGFRFVERRELAGQTNLVHRLNRDVWLSR